MRVKTNREMLMHRKTAPSILEDIPPEPGPAPPDGAAEIPHRSDTAPPEIGSHPRDRYPTPRPEELPHTKTRRTGERKHRQVGKESAKVKRPSGPPPHHMDPVTEPDDTKTNPPEISGDDSNPPEREVIDLTIKEESRPTTPVPPTQAPESREDPAGLKAGWVRPPRTLDLPVF